MDFDRIGKYEIVGKLGQGAMGQVFKAYDPILSRHVAIKTMSAESGADEELRRRFQREAQSAAQLNHPNIITVFDFGEEDGRAYMAMELLEGTDLKNMIGDPRVSLDEKMSVMEQICDGLSFAHDRQVVHRDLKPANIHILPNGQVKIMDFGLARLGSSDMTKTGMVMGTPNYMSPEQVRGEKVDVRSDIFSIGAVFYELLTVHKPFQAESMHAVLFQVLENDPEPPRRWVPSLPPVLVDLVEKALSKDPSDRFQNAAEMLDAVREARQVIPPEIALMTTSAADQTSPTVAVDLPRSDPPGMSRTRVSSGRRSRTALGPQAAALPSSSGTVQPADLPRTLLGRAPTKVDGARARSGARRTVVVAPPAATSRRSPALVAAGGVALLCLAAGLFWVLGPKAHRQEAPSSGSPQVGALQAQLAATQLQLAHKSLEDKDYKSAVAQAAQALKIDPGNAEAGRLLEQARNATAELESTARKAREAFDAGDYGTASQSLSKLLALDPNHPAAADLTSRLNSHFRSQAEDARGAARSAQTAAEQARARSSPGFSDGVGLAREGEAAFGHREYASAARKWLDARDSFDRARRNVAERPMPTPPPTPTTLAQAVTTTLPPITQAPVTLPPPPVTAPPVTAPPPTLPPAPIDEEPAIRRIVAEYGRAIEQKDLALFKKVKPNLTSDEERRLREAFEGSSSDAVRIEVNEVRISGAQATVRLSRKDSIGGRIQTIQQTLLMVKGPAGWTIREIGR